MWNHHMILLIGAEKMITQISVFIYVKRTFSKLGMWRDFYNLRRVLIANITLYGLPKQLSSKESVCQCRSCRTCRFNPGSRRSPEGEKGNLLKYSCQDNRIDRETWWATVPEVAKSPTRLKWLSTDAHILYDEMLMVKCWNLPLEVRNKTQMHVIISIVISLKILASVRKQTNA